MRDVPGLSPLLDKAVARAGEHPLYRFHGHRSPANRTRTPVLAQAPRTSTKDGVATLRLYDPIDSWGGPWGVSAIDVVDALESLDENAIDEIRLRINSPGGEVWEALAIMSNLRDFDAKIVAQVDGIAASAASFIACAADETVMAPNTQLMIHDAWGLCIGNADDMKSTGDLLNKISDNIADIYATKAGGTTADWRDVMKGEAWYNADEAVEAGLADSVAGDESEEDPTDAFDLKGMGMKFKGRSEAPAPAPRVPAAPTAPVPDDADEDRRLRFQQRRHAATAKRVGEPAA